MTCRSSPRRPPHFVARYLFQLRVACELSVMQPADIGPTARDARAPSRPASCATRGDSATRLHKRAAGRVGRRISARRRRYPAFCFGLATQYLSSFQLGHAMQKTLQYFHEHCGLGHSDKSYYTPFLLVRYKVEHAFRLVVPPFWSSTFLAQPSRSPNL